MFGYEITGIRYPNLDTRTPDPETLNPADDPAGAQLHPRARREMLHCQFPKSDTRIQIPETRILIPETEPLVLEPEAESKRVMYIPDTRIQIPESRYKPGSQFPKPNP